VKKNRTRVSSTADVDPTAFLGAGSCVWHLAQVRNDAVIGSNCNIGRGAYIGSGVRIGDNCKIQDNSLIYEPANISPGVFIGPGVILTNDLYPRAVNPDLIQKSGFDWQKSEVRIQEGASIGAGSVCVAPVNIGKWAMVAAGSVVVSDVADFALVAGIPAKRLKWVGKHGFPLVQESESIFVCPKSGWRYEQLDDEVLVQEVK
jgi:acetyltransferase-like isoleucine patch superfamily enzyme